MSFSCFHSLKDWAVDVEIWKFSSQKNDFFLHNMLLINSIFRCYRVVRVHMLTCTCLNNNINKFKCVTANYPVEVNLSKLCDIDNQALEWFIELCIFLVTKTEQEEWGGYWPQSEGGGRQGFVEVSHLHHLLEHLMFIRNKSFSNMPMSVYIAKYN